MPPTIALLLWFILLVLLLFFDPAREKGASVALWVPVVWMFFVGSRLPSQWLGLQRSGIEAQVLQEGNPVDRLVFSVLILLAVVVLVSRSFHWGDLSRQNLALVAFLGFALLSVVWSDFTFIAFKRWIRDFEDYLAVLVVLSDPRPLEAVRTVVRRVCYLLIPLSIVLIKYFPSWGRGYSLWTGQVEYTGVATTKNMLGVVCLLSGMLFFWDTITRWSDRKDPAIKRVILINVAFIAMTLWLLSLAHSATSSVCLAIGCFVIVAAQSKIGTRHPGLLKTLGPATFFIYLILALGLGLNGKMAETVGRNPTLTTRTEIWQVLLSMHTNPFLGTGYDSFWLGPRLQYVWQRYGQINEAHNGYLQIYLELGLVGLFLLCSFLISTYRRICKRLEPVSAFGSLGLALWTVLLFYNVTEASFCGGFLWIPFLMAAVSVPEHVNAEDSATPPVASFSQRFAAIQSRKAVVRIRSLTHRPKVGW